MRLMPPLLNSFDICCDNTVSQNNLSYVGAMRINGYDFPCNLISDAYVRNEDLSVEENDIYVLIVDFKIETDVFNGLINMINDVIVVLASSAII